MLKWKFSALHILLLELWYKKLYHEYKTSPVRVFCEKYNISHHTAKKVFGPKMTPSKKIIVKILRQEWDARRIREIADSNIL